MSEEIFIIIFGSIASIFVIYLYVKLIKFLQRKFGKNRYEKPVKINKKRDKKDELYSKNIIREEQGNKKCSKCGNEIEDGMIFCDKCGSRIK